jgi:uncharacterized protein involved in response to NO
MKTSTRTPPPAASGPWRWSQLLQAPYRLAFLLAMVVLVASGFWWLLLQLARLGLRPGLATVLAPGLVHGALMSFGFMPLFFSGFLFTAGPRWLHVPLPSGRALAPALLAQAAGWLLWLAGAHVHAAVALAGLALATAGPLAVTVRFWRLVRASKAPDRLHAKLIGCALVAGCACYLGLAIAVAFGADAVARRFVVTGLWSFVVLVFVVVGHRTIPFFTSDSLPALRRGGADWVLALMLSMVLFEGLAGWLEPLLPAAVPWRLLRGAIELAASVPLLWLARGAAALRSLKIRFMAMLHLGFLWFGLALALGGASQLVAAVSGTPVLPLGALHAMAMGCLGSLLLATVSRVISAHAGRALVVDNFLWALFWLLQAAVLLRLAAAASAAPVLPAAAAALWTAAVLAWGFRYGRQYGR